MENKIEELIKNLISEGNTINDIRLIFNKSINFNIKTCEKKTKKTKKKKICRPVFIISDSSCDEFT